MVKENLYNIYNLQRIFIIRKIQRWIYKHVVDGNSVMNMNNLYQAYPLV